MIPLYALTLALFATTVNIVDAQQNFSCLPLQQSKVCPGFNSLLPDVSSLFDTEKKAAWNTAADFDNYFRTNYLPTRLSSFYVNRMKCPSFPTQSISSLPHLRYFNTYECSSFFTRISVLPNAPDKQCNGGAQLPQLCVSTCRQFIESLRKLVRNSTYCDLSSTAVADRNSVIDNIERSCAVEQSTCAKGEVNEPGMCGWTSKDDVCSLCTQEAGNRDTGKVGALCAASVSAGVTSSDGTSNMSNIAMYVGIVIGALLLACIAFVSVKRRRSQKSSDRRASLPHTVTPSKEDLESFTTLTRTKDYNSLASSLTPLTTPTKPSFSDVAVPVPPIPSEQMRAVAKESGNAVNPAQFGTQPLRLLDVDPSMKTLHVVIHAFEPGMKDEIALQVAEFVRVTKTYSDGWCKGVNLVTGETGVFPVGCISPIDVRRLDRNSYISVNSFNEANETASVTAPAGKDEKRLSALPMELKNKHLTEILSNPHRLSLRLDTVPIQIDVDEEMRVLEVKTKDVGAVGPIATRRPNWSPNLRDSIVRTSSLSPEDAKVVVTKSDSSEKVDNVKDKLQKDDDVPVVDVAADEADDATVIGDDE
ncbi:hypothetical protein BKA69DRAFT_1123696 [Paraphysoderma sedebokerense]|nr:hypothetical protein BKA69DRAFT_1123696 [Paraphysoderma sedebokerense]